MPLLHTLNFFTRVLISNYIRINCLLTGNITVRVTLQPRNSGEADVGGISKIQYHTKGIYINIESSCGHGLDVEKVSVGINNLVKYEMLLFIYLFIFTVSVESFPFSL